MALYSNFYGQDAAIWSNLKAFTAIISTCRCSSSLACLGDFEAPNCPSGFVSLSKKGWYIKSHQTCQFSSRSKIGILTLSVFLVQCSKMFKVYRFSISFPFTLSFLGYILFTHKPLYISEPKSHRQNWDACCRTLDGCQKESCSGKGPAASRRKKAPSIL